jgi:hypothetical protein
MQKGAGAVGFAVVVALLASSCVLKGAWTVTAPIDPLPGGSPAHLRHVSCPTSDFCLGVGSDAAATNGLLSTPFVQTWDGVAWSSVPPPPNPPGATFVGLEGVSCGTPSSCIVEIRSFASPTTTKRFVLWNGSTWSNALGNGTTSVDTAGACAPDGSCVLALQGVGTVVWDGATSTTHTPTITPELDSLSCTASDECVGVLSRDRWQSWHWDGTTWSSRFLPVVENFRSWQSVSCTSPEDCLAVGFEEAPFPDTDFWAVAAHYDGTAWTETATPVTAVASLEAVSCTSAIACVSIGYETRPAGWAPVALGWNGGQWYRIPDPPVGADIGCGTDDACMAVGATAGRPAAAIYDWSTAP